jgi:hypothetical protein
VGVFTVPCVYPWTRQLFSPVERSTHGSNAAELVYVRTGDFVLGRFETWSTLHVNTSHNLL